VKDVLGRVGSVAWLAFSFVMAVRLIVGSSPGNSS